MGLIHIMERGDEKSERFENAMYDIMEAAEEACDIYEEMKEEFSQRRSDPNRMDMQEPAYSRGGYNRGYSRGGYNRNGMGGANERRMRMRRGM